MGSAAPSFYMGSGDRSLSAYAGTPSTPLHRVPSAPAWRLISQAQSATLVQSTCPQSLWTQEN